MVQIELEKHTIPASPGFSEGSNRFIAELAIQWKQKNHQ